MLLIEKTEDLREYCKTLKKEKFITVDLEFMREKTYYAQICLIQVGCKKSAAIIDPLAKGIDLSPFWEIMQNKKIIKVFHACRQDIEIIYNLSGHIPTPIFDTQIAAMVCGFGEFSSYESLVNELLGRELDKSCRLTNWHRRPLDEKELEYAISDVTHLVEIYEKLAEKLKESGREHWIDEETEELQNPQLYDVNPEDAWQKIRYSSHNAKFLRVLKNLAKWREERAKSHNIPRQTVIKDDCLVSVAAMLPKSVSELSQVRNIRPDILNGKLAAEILDIVKNSANDHSIKLPKIEKHHSVPVSEAQLFELLKMMLKLVSQQEGVVAKIVASDDELKQLCAFKEDKNNPVLKGWRYDLFGKKAMLLREGKITICYNCTDKKIEFKQQEA